VIVGKEEMRTIREAAQAGKQKDALMISQAELERMKGSTVIKSKDEQIQQKKLLDEQKDQQMAAAKVSTLLLTLLATEKEDGGNGPGEAEEDPALRLPKGAV
jgi:hypothetical protein